MGLRCVECENVGTEKAALFIVGGISLCKPHQKAYKIMLYEQIKIERAKHEENQKKLEKEAGN